MWPAQSVGCRAWPVQSVGVVRTTGCAHVRCMRWRPRRPRKAAARLLRHVVRHKTTAAPTCAPWRSCRKRLALLSSAGAPVVREGRRPLTDPVCAEHPSAHAPPFRSCPSVHAPVVLVPHRARSSRPRPIPVCTQHPTHTYAHLRTHACTNARTHTCIPAETDGEGRRAAGGPPQGAARLLFQACCSPHPVLFRQVSAAARRLCSLQYGHASGRLDQVNLAWAGWANKQEQHFPTVHFACCMSHLSSTPSPLFHRRPSPGPAGPTQGEGRERTTSPTELSPSLPPTHPRVEKNHGTCKGGNVRQALL